MRISDRGVARAAAADHRNRLFGGLLLTVPPQTSLTYHELKRPKRAEAFIKSNRGNIEIRLLVAAAQLRVLDFVRLAEKGYYDRLRFRRTVPNFVVQSGDSWAPPVTRFDPSSANTPTCAAPSA